MKRLDDVLTRQKNGLMFDAIFAIVLVLAIGLATLGLAQTLTVSSGWSDTPRLAHSASPQSDSPAVAPGAGAVAGATVTPGT